MRSVSTTTASNAGGLARALYAATLAFRRELARAEPAGVAEGAAAPNGQERGSGGTVADPSEARDFRDGFCARWRMPEIR
ncbi:MAG: hypothetical protein JXA15_12495 [Spirochaetales bacterium]|nr:hypothetical protein [Spirochaetales bacterium]